MIPRYKHTRKIKKGKLGHYSKIREEFEEFRDAHKQGIALFEIIELSDLLGAIIHYTWTQYRIVSPILYLLMFGRGMYKMIVRPFRRKRELSKKP